MVWKDFLLLMQTKANMDKMLGAIYGATFVV